MLVIVNPPVFFLLELKKMAYIIFNKDIL